MKSYSSVCAFILYLFFLYACNSSRQGIFGRKSPHERYQSALQDAGLTGTELYKAWANAAQKGLKAPLTIAIPYKETGFFPAETPRSAGYAFSMQEGEKISFVIEKQPVTGHIFSELWKMEDTTRKLLYAADSLEYRWEVEIKDKGKYLVRIQPELLHAVSYTITITAGPSLAFPVRTSDNPKTSGFWGDSRDAGGRKHEGIDIFTPKRTPAVAAADGIVTRVGTNNLGGKIVFMRPGGKNYSLYYAHLDTQMVQEGQNIETGDIVGLIGNTGNARNTPPHLHFGIYASSGATDPFPFVNANRPSPPDIKADTSQISKILRTTVKARLLSSLIPSAPYVTLEKGTLTITLAGAADWFKVELPDGATGYIKSDQLTAKPLQQKLKPGSDTLFDAPSPGSAVRSGIATGTPLTVYGVWHRYAYVEAGNHRGWILRREEM
ncbi:M23 family metallopeptidase [Agriterribacter sp.]|uniref:M23 family metallopeptidase n=1 Tax=Agriterribacter sp. TaxID=2821509 RepID=UPI002BD74EDA|nr:M23 family metallopeptidase [Agriterribacter sp.]HRP55799.1 M23 family metallopeptidase [Agriterribacter sp.]